MYKITGGKKLQGTIPIYGAKNAASKQIIATLLTDEPCILSNIPQIAEIQSALSIVAALGAQYHWIDDHTLHIQTPKIHTTTVDLAYSGVNRLPILLLGLLLSRCGSAEVPLVGGCYLGDRPIDFHCTALQRMGANIEIGSHTIKACSDKPLVGTRIELPFPSAGATENSLFAACLASGTTVIENESIKPEVIDTVAMLQKMGAQIHLEADRTLVIYGVSLLRGVSHATMADPIEIASWAALALANGGHITITNPPPQSQIVTLLSSVQRMGGDFYAADNRITFYRKATQLHAITLETDVFPGFETDWQQPFVVAMTQATGSSVVHETIYNDRFGFTKTLNEMGAHIAVLTSCLGAKSCRFLNKNFLHSAIVSGPTHLLGEAITIPDLRAGFAYIIAALVAEGTSFISGIQHLDRGYPDVVNRLKGLGAIIEVV